MSLALLAMLPHASRAEGVSTNANNRTERLLQAITIPEIRFNATPFKDAVARLNESIRTYATTDEGKSLQAVLVLPGGESKHRADDITLTARRQTALVVARLMASVAQYTLETEEGQVKFIVQREKKQVQQGAPPLPSAPQAGPSDGAR